jgi:hypothetical protein
MIAQFESLGKAEAAIGKAQAAFGEIVDFVRMAADSEELRMDDIERTVFTMTQAANLHLFEVVAAAAGDGDYGETVERDGKTLVRSDKKTKFYRSIFGVLTIERYLYSRGAKRKTEWAPVDARLGLPAGEQSYVLEDWMVRLCVKESFAEGVGTLSDLLGVKSSVRAAEVMARNMAEHTVSRRAKPASHRRVKTSHLRRERLVLRVSLRQVRERRPVRGESAQDGEIAVDTVVTRATLVPTPDRARVGRRSGDGPKVPAGALVRVKTGQRADRLRRVKTSQFERLPGWRVKTSQCADRCVVGGRGAQTG